MTTPESKFTQMPCLESLSLKKDRRSLEGDGIVEKGNTVDMKEDAKMQPSPVLATTMTYRPYGQITYS